MKNSMNENYTIDPDEKNEQNAKKNSRKNE